MKPDELKEKKMTIYDVVKKLLGEINPVGKTEIDEARFENLKTTTELVDLLIRDIDDVSFNYRDRIEFSIKRSSDFAKKFLDELDC